MLMVCVWGKARDIQAWEYVPLGPFTSKSFATSISPWVVLMDALAPFRTAPLQRTSSTPLHPYLQESQSAGVYDIALKVSINGHTIAKTSAKNLLWSFPQMVAHHTITGCPLRTGDLLGTGTISGTEKGSVGSLLEASGNGTVAVKVGEGERRWLEDGDEVVMEGVCGPGVGFGRVSGRVLAAWPGKGE